jgi:hypothetical protein
MMFDIVANNGYPAMLALLPYRKAWGGKVPVGEIAHGYRKQVLERAGVIPERRSAGWTKVKAAGVAAIGDMFVDFVIARYRHSIGKEARLHSKG